MRIAIRHGVPQGSVFGLFTLCVVSCLFYADDAPLYLSGSISETPG